MVEPVQRPKKVSNPSVRESEVPRASRQEATDFGRNTQQPIGLKDQMPELTSHLIETAEQHVPLRRFPTQECAENVASVVGRCEPTLHLSGSKLAPFPRYESESEKVKEVERTVRALTCGVREPVVREEPFEIVFIKTSWATYCLDCSESRTVSPSDLFGQLLTLCVVQ